MLSKKRTIELHGEIHFPKTLHSHDKNDHTDSSAVWIAGGIGFVGVEIRNHSKSKVMICY